MSGNSLLRSIVDRILRLKGEQDALADDIKEIYAEAKGNGYDKARLGEVVTILRKKAKDPAAFEERQAILEIYLAELGEETSHTYAPARVVIPAAPVKAAVEEIELGEPREAVGGTAREAPIRQARSPADGTSPLKGPSGTAATDAWMMPEEIPANLRRVG